MAVVKPVTRIRESFCAWCAHHHALPPWLAILGAAAPRKASVAATRGYQGFQAGCGGLREPKTRHFQAKNGLIPASNGHEQLLFV